MKKLVLIVSSLFIAATQNAQIELWGMTAKGGVSNNGVLFQFDISNSICTKKLDFSGVTSGSLPNGSLIKASDGRLYGMTATGGQNGFGTIFQYDISTGTYTKKFDFDGVAHGRFPNGSLMQATDGLLYGLTSLGGINGRGVIFQYDINTNVITKLFDFSSANNAVAEPQGNLIQLSTGKMYGLTMGGFGNIFEFDPITHILVNKFSFVAPSTGYNPPGSLVEAVDGNLYGMTLLGGVIFQYNPSTSVYTIKVNLGTSQNPGYQPWGSLMSASDGKLYGMTEIGGIYNSGVLFQYDPISNVYTKKIDFDGINIGSSPKGTLMQSSNGSIFGLTSKGGANNFGVLFEFDLMTQNISKKLDFDSINGSIPAYTSLIEVPSIPTGINNFNKVNNILLYPNPNNGSFTIDIKTKSQITITNVLGEIVLSQSLEIGKQNLTIQSQSNGIYFVKITDDKGLSNIQKIVKQ